MLIYLSSSSLIAGSFYRAKALRGARDAKKLCTATEDARDSTGKSMDTDMNAALQLVLWVSRCHHSSVL